jgi:hypothetical protein
VPTDNPPLGQLGDPETVVIADSDAARGSKAKTIDLPRLGLRIVVGLLSLVGVVLVLVALFSWRTSPSLSAYADVLGRNSSAVDAYKEAESTWFGQIKDLLQLLLVSLLVPLIATVIGYIFGRKAES